VAEPILVAWQSTDSDVARIMEKTKTSNTTVNQSSLFTATPTSDPQWRSISKPAIVGIIIGILTVIGIAVGAGLLWWKQKQQSTFSNTKEDNSFTWGKPELDAEVKKLPPELDNANIVELEGGGIAEVADNNLA
jgi:hypothetical protein